MKYTDYEMTFPKPDLLVNRKDLDFFLFDWLKIDAEDLNLTASKSDGQKGSIGPPR